MRMDSFKIRFAEEHPTDQDGNRRLLFSRRGRNDNLEFIEFNFIIDYTSASEEYKQIQ